jgi:toxin-antitoxin system PIN domain toxin
MIYLLDVNALLALVLSEHVHHDRALAWVQNLARKGNAHLLTCPITELGFIRILSQAGVYNRSVAEAKRFLERVKSGKIVRFSFQPDNIPASDLPGWVVRPNQITDGYLVNLAVKHGARLATLDEKIPGAFLIPH